MEGFFILTGLALAVIAFVLPIVALVLANKARSENAELRLRLIRLGQEIQDLRGAGPPAAPSPAVPIPPSPAVPAAPAPVPPAAVWPATATPPPSAPAPKPATPPPLVIPPRVPGTRATSPPPVPTRAPAATAPRRPINWEQFMGVKMLAWLGGLALFLGAAFFLKVSIERGWIPPALRAALGFVAGAGLLVGGLWSAGRRYATTGHSLCATGVVTLYAVTFSCRALYHFPFFGVIPTFAVMALITATAFLLAVRLRAQVIAVLGLLGGFLTPVLLSTGVDNPLGLFGYVTLLDLGLLAVALRCRWHHLAVLAAIGTAALQVGWAATFFSLAKLPVAVAVCLLFVALFTAAVGAARRFQGASDWLVAAAVVTAVTALGFSIFFTGLSAVAARPGWVLGNVLGADCGLLAVALLHPRALRLHVVAGLAVLAVAALWIAWAATNALLPWALGFVFLFAALHTVFPFVARRFQPGVDERSVVGIFAPVGLLVLLLPVLQFESVSWVLWPAVLLLNLVALAAAVVSRMILALAVAIVVTLGVLGIAITRVPAGGGLLELGLTAGFALFFVAAATWALRRLGGEFQANAGRLDAMLPRLPGAAAAMPFVLLVMLVTRLALVDPSPVFGVALLLDVLVLGLVAVTRQGSLAIAGLIGTLLVEYAWFDAHGPMSANIVALLWFAGFAALFLVFPFAARTRVLTSQSPWAAAALALPLHFYLLHHALALVWPNDVGGVLAAVCALPPLVGLLLLLRWIPADAPFRLNRLAWFGAAGLFFITLVFPLQFSRQWITLGWALEGAALLWLFHRIPHPGLRVAGVGLSVAVFVRLILNPAIFAYASRGEAPVFNWILYTYGLASLCAFAGARLLAPPRDRVLGVRAPALLATIGTILAFALVNLEIADYFAPAGAPLELEFSANFARDMCYTIAWSLFAFILLAAGIMRRLRAARYAAIALLGIAILKLFLRDLSRLDQLYRVGAFMAVAVVAIAASFLYQRFLRTVEEKAQ